MNEVGQIGSQVPPQGPFPQQGQPSQPSQPSQPQQHEPFNRPRMEEGNVPSQGQPLQQAPSSQTSPADPEPRDFEAPPATQEEGLALSTTQLLNTLIEGQTVLVSVKFLRNLLREGSTPKVVTKLRERVQAAPRVPAPNPPTNPNRRGRVAGKFKVRDLRLTGRNWNDSMNAVYTYVRQNPEGVTVRETADGLDMPLSTAHNCLRKLLKKQALRWVRG